MSLQEGQSLGLFDREEKEMVNEQVGGGRGGQERGGSLHWGGGELIVILLFVCRRSRCGGMTRLDVINQTHFFSTDALLDLSVLPHAHLATPHS